MKKETEKEKNLKLARERKTLKQKLRRLEKRGGKVSNQSVSVKEIKEIDKAIEVVKPQRDEKLIEYATSDIDKNLIKISDEKFLQRVDSVDDKLITLINADVVDILEQEEWMNSDGDKQTRMSLKDLNTLTKEQRACISKVKYLKDGGVEVVFFDKLKAIDMFYKRVGAYRGNRASVDGSAEKGKDGGVNVNVVGENVQVVACTGDNGRGKKVE